MPVVPLAFAYYLGGCFGVGLTVALRDPSREHDDFSCGGLQCCE